MVLAGCLALHLASGSQREHAVLHPDASAASLEQLAAERPSDDDIRARLALHYLDAHAPGLAIGLLERGAARSPKLEHVYARALLEQGRAADALAAERRVLEACASHDCSGALITSATHRAEVFASLVALGIEDAPAHPEAAHAAYHRATRQVSLAVR